MTGSFLDNSTLMTDLGYRYVSMDTVNNNRISVNYEKNNNPELGTLSCSIIYFMDEVVEKMHFEFNSKELYLIYFNECQNKMTRDDRWGYDYFFKNGVYGFGFVKFFINEKYLYEIDIVRY